MAIYNDGDEFARTKATIAGFELGHSQTLLGFVVDWQLFVCACLLETLLPTCLNLILKDNFTFFFLFF